MFKWQFVQDSRVYITESVLVTKKEELPRTFIYHSHHFQPLAPFSSSNFASFSLLANYSSFKLTSKKAIKACKYLTSIQNLLDASFDLSHIAQTVEFLLDD